MKRHECKPLDFLSSARSSGGVGDLDRTGGLTCRIYDRQCRRGRDDRRTWREHEFGLPTDSQKRGSRRPCERCERNETMGHNNTSCVLITPRFTIAPSQYQTFRYHNASYKIPNSKRKRKSSTCGKLKRQKSYASFLFSMIGLVQLACLHSGYLEHP